MSELTPAQIVLTLACAIAALAAGYLLFMRMGNHVLDDLETPRIKCKLPYQPRCSTAPDVSSRQVAAIVGMVLLLGAIALLSSTWLGQELVEYLARMFWAARPR